MKKATVKEGLHYDTPELETARKPYSIAKQALDKATTDLKCPKIKYDILRSEDFIKNYKIPKNKLKDALTVEQWNLSALQKERMDRKCI